MNIRRVSIATLGVGIGALTAGVFGMNVSRSCMLHAAIN